MGARHIRDRKSNAQNVLVKKAEGKNNLEDLSVDGKITLYLILMK
jgi:hypothetical protein